MPKSLKSSPSGPQFLRFILVAASATMVATEDNGSQAETDTDGIRNLSSTDANELEHCLIDRVRSSESQQILS